MKLKLDLSDEKLKDNLKDNQELLIVLSVFGVAIVLFIIFIIPSIISFPSKVGDRNAEIEKLNQIKKAKTVLEAIDQTQLDLDLETASNTLPTDKNFELVLGAISEAATKSNAIVTDYKYTSTPNATEVIQGEYPGLIFKISVAGGVDQAAAFADQLKIVYPISDVKLISYERGISELEVVFYYKPFTEVDAQDVALAREKTPEEIKALEEVSGWSVFNLEQIFFDEIASESASPF